MKVYILMGSPRRNGNTASLLDPFVSELKREGALVGVTNLYDKKINPCIACRKCQDFFGGFGCPQEDDCVPFYMLCFIIENRSQICKANLNSQGDLNGEKRYN